MDNADLNELCEAVRKLSDEVVKLQLAAESEGRRPEDIIRYDNRCQHLRRRASTGPIIDELGWEIVSELYLARSECRKCCVKQVTLSTGAPSTTVLNRIKKLVETGCVTKSPSPKDARVIYLDLTPKAINQIENWARWRAKQAV